PVLSRAHQYASPLFPLVARFHQGRNRAAVSPATDPVRRRRPRSLRDRALVLRLRPRSCCRRPPDAAPALAGRRTTPCFRSVHLDLLTSQHLNRAR
uniref:Uncharacterized protein n=1 Tax=Aegilops tauschii subsp. strangulata TaxID=200361 RepID=A0A453GPB8_AEGTS